MKIHKEGTATLIFTISMIIGMIFAALSTEDIKSYIFWGVAAVFMILLPFFLWFFRLPNRLLPENMSAVVCPADGEVVVIEQTHEVEYLKKDCIQISIFMSPLNVHAQWYPVNGEVVFKAYHPGKHLVAWHPKSSTDNERSTVVLKTESDTEILIRQIAGAVARRIVTYSEKGDQAKQGDELGFIKFGSRVDVFLPIGTDIKVKKGDMVIGKESILAQL